MTFIRAIVICVVLSICTSSVYALDEKTEKEVFYKIVQCQDYYMKLGIDGEKDFECRVKVGESYGLSQEEVLQIIIKGVNNHWPIPPLPK